VPIQSSHRLLAWFACLFLALAASPAAAHPAPLSYVNIDLQDDKIAGSVIVHNADVAHELDMPEPQMLLSHDVLHARQGEIVQLLEKRLGLVADGKPLTYQWTEAEPTEARDAIQLAFTIPGPPPGSLTVQPALFTYDAQHQTFVNVYEQGELAQQWIMSVGADPETFYAGSRQGLMAVIKTFVESGIHHILIGPDHLLFLLGLLLMGGSMWGLVRIVTAFTIGHSITLTLAALDIVTLPSIIVEPAIALTIVVVGADNLLRGQGRDLRFWLALGFGLIHGFGFASVLQDFGLPQSALGWSLFSFNVGVELGQLAFVVPVALALGAIRRWNPVLGQRVAIAGSIIVIGAGAYWFVERVFLG